MVRNGEKIQCLGSPHPVAPARNAFSSSSSFSFSSSIFCILLQMRACLEKTPVFRGRRTRTIFGILIIGFIGMTAKRSAKHVQCAGGGRRSAPAQKDTPETPEIRGHLRRFLQTGLDAVKLASAHGSPTEHCVDGKQPYALCAPNGAPLESLSAFARRPMNCSDWRPPGCALVARRGPHQKCMTD